jgi:FtsP/CotA-like multicopper oxidase with cupredoxin domain
MSIVAVDGAPVHPTDTSSITLGAGQRYDVVITAKHSANRNYRITSKMVDSLKSTTGTLKYTKASRPFNILPQIQLAALNFDDIYLRPTSGQPLLSPVSRTVYLSASEIRTDLGPR